MLNYISLSLESKLIGFIYTGASTVVDFGLYVCTRMAQYDWTNAWKLDTSQQIKSSIYWSYETETKKNKLIVYAWTCIHVIVYTWICIHAKETMFMLTLIIDTRNSSVYALIYAPIVFQNKTHFWLT